MEHHVSYETGADEGGAVYSEDGGGRDEIGAGSNWKGLGFQDVEVGPKARASGGDAGAAVVGERGRPATRREEDGERVSGC